MDHQHDKQHEKQQQTTEHTTTTGMPQPAPGGQSITHTGSQAIETPQQQGGTVQPTSVITPVGTFINRLSKILPSMGTSVQDPKMVNQGAATPPAGITLPAGGGPVYIPLGSNGTGTGSDIVLSRPIIAGYVRIKAYGAGTVTAIIVTCTDGTNTETICNETCSVALSATAGMTKTIIFETEINPVVFAITLTGGTGATCSIEVAGATGY